MYMDYCACGKRCAQLVKHGLFPSTPVRPRTLFAISLLELLHLQAIRGACSKYAWAEGLRDLLKGILGIEILSFHVPVSFIPPNQSRGRVATTQKVISSALCRCLRPITIGLPRNTLSGANYIPTLQSFNKSSMVKQPTGKKMRLQIYVHPALTFPLYHMIRRFRYRLMVICSIADTAITIK